MELGNTDQNNAHVFIEHLEQETKWSITFILVFKTFKNGVKRRKRPVSLGVRRGFDLGWGVDSLTEW